MLAYILRWAEIYVAQPVLLEVHARSGSSDFVGWVGPDPDSERRLQLPLPRRRAGRRPARPSPLADDPRREGRLHRPRRSPSALFAEAGEPKELWIVPEAKHNRCREVEPAGLRRAGRVVPPPVRPARPRRRARRRPATSPRRPPIAADESPASAETAASPAATAASAESGRAGLRLMRLSRPGRVRPVTSPRFRSDRFGGIHRRRWLGVSRAGSRSMFHLIQQARRPSARCGGRARLAQAFLEQTQRRRRGPARPAPRRGSPATPTASSAATTTSREIRRPADFRRRVPDPRLRRPRALHRPRPPGRPRRPVRRRDRGPDVRHDLGHDQPAQDDPRHRASRSTTTAKAGRSGASWPSTPTPRCSSAGLKPILQLASDWRESFTPAGHPLRRDHRPDGPHAEPAGPDRPTACRRRGSRIKDIESKYYVALRLSVYRDLGATIAANPSTILAIARLGDREKATPDPRPRRRHDRPEVGRSPPRSARRCRRRTRWKRKEAARRLEAIVKRTGRLLPKDYWPNLCFLANWTGGTMGAYLRGYPEFFGDRPVRDVGLIASEGRMTIPIEDGTPAGILDIRHHYFEFIPEDQADRERARDGRGRRADRGPALLHPAHDRGRALPLPDPRPGPLRRLPRQGPADRVPEQGGALLEPDRREALRVPGGRRRQRGPAARWASGSARSCSCRPGATRRITACWSRRPTSPTRPRPTGWPRRSRPSSTRQNVEYENKRATLRLGPIRIAASPPARGPISSSDGWRGAAEPSNNISSRT